MTVPWGKTVYCLHPRTCVFWIVPANSTLELVADLIIKRVAAECEGADDATLRFALNSACPFADLNESKFIWQEAVSNFFANRAIAGNLR